ncbi:MAG TPA: DNA-binding transcriptional regulator [Isosphaeraceae bacterium]|jgi:LacI family transcriptional regulator
MPTYPHVALIVETAKQYDRGLLRGIGRYVRGHGPWSIYLEERGSQDAIPAWLKAWRGDGIIARIRDVAMAEALLATGAPVVELRRQVVEFDLPAVHCDDEAISDLAVAHFRERGFGHFAYCGRPRERWSDLREGAFRRRLAEIGLACHTYPRPRRARPLTWEQEQDDVARWLAALPRPVAVLACNDLRGLQVLDACRRTGLSVPGSVAVLGVDNDATLAELSDPPLSSIDQDLERIGFEAAGLLDRLMGGEPAPGEPILVEPRGVVARLSTDSVAIDDPAVATALRLIRQHARGGRGIDALAERTGLSRRALQRRFKALTGRTLQCEILDAQLARVRQMLTETDLKLETIAMKSGFNYVGYMCSFFKQRAGMTPGTYRRLHSRASL